MADIIDDFQQDADSCSIEELAMVFPYRYNNTSKIELTDQSSSDSFVQLAVNKKESSLAAASKEGEICHIDVSSGCKISTHKTHKASVTGLKFCPINTNLLYSCSSDRTIQITDMRTNKNEVTHKFGVNINEGQEFTCIDINCSGEFMCAGTTMDTDKTGHLVFWDVRKSNDVLGSYSDSHQLDITHVNFHPSKKRILASAAMDGLINVFDIAEKDEYAAYSNCINLETIPDVIQFDPHSDHKNNMFVVSYPQVVQYWDIDATAATSKYGAKKLCKAIKRQRPEDCHFMSLNFDSDLNPLLMVSSNFNQDSKKDACLRTLSYNREKRKAKPHAVLEFSSTEVGDVIDSLYLGLHDLFVTLEPGSLDYWTLVNQKRGHTEDDSHTSAVAKNKRQKM